MKENIILNTIHTKPLSAQELLAMPDDAIAYDDDNPKADIQEWAGAVMSVNRKTIGRTRGKQKSPTKVATTVRLDSRIIEHFKAGGKGWQTRMNDALLEWISR